jgi:serine/threonine protein kinase
VLGILSAVTIQVTDFNLHKLIEMDPPRDLPASDIDLFVDFLSCMFKILPHERETPAQLLNHPWLQDVAQGATISGLV